MATARTRPAPVEVESLDDLRDALAAAKSTNGRVTIRSDDGEEFELRPIRRQDKQRSSAEREQADIDAFLSAAGGWKGLIDAETFKRQIKAARGSRRPPVELSLPDE